MATRPTPVRTRHAEEVFGGHIRTWRKLHELTVEQLADRVGVNRAIISRLERGDGGVSLDVVLTTLNALGQLDRVVDAADPYGTVFGRARSQQILPQRVRN